MRNLFCFILVINFSFASCLFAETEIYTVSQNSKIFNAIRGNFKNAVEVFVGGARVDLVDESFDVVLGEISDDINSIPILVNYNDGVSKQHYHDLFEEVSYDDLAPGYWAYDIVYKLSQARVVSGNSVNLFNSRDDIFYNDLVHWVANAAGLSVNSLKGLKKINERKVSRLEAIEFIYNNLTMIRANKSFQKKTMNNFLEWKKMPQLVAKAITNNIISGASREWVRIDLDRYTYRDEAAKLIYYTKEAQEKINNYKVIRELYKASGVPNVSKLNVLPVEIINGKTKYITFKLKPSDSDGLSDLKNVMLDPTGFSDIDRKIYMLDSGDWGDLKKRDYEYSMQVPISDNISAGKYIVDFYVTDKKGWQSKLRASFNVLLPRLTLPVLNKVNYKYIDGKLRITAIVFDEGDDISFVAVDLSNIGLSDRELMIKDEMGEYFYEVAVNFKRINGKKIKVYVKDSDDLVDTKEFKI